MLTLLLASDSSTSTLFRFPLVVRTLRLEDARETVTREEGLGESFNLHRKQNAPFMKHTSPPALKVGIKTLHVHS